MVPVVPLDATRSYPCNPFIILVIPVVVIIIMTIIKPTIITIIERASRKRALA